MQNKTCLRHITDCAMTVAMVLLMSYTVTSQPVHEWLGIGAFALFVLHHLLNLGWLRALKKGRYTSVRTLQTVLVTLLFISVLAQTVSGVAMSRHALPFLNLPISTSTARLLHLSSTYWSFLLISLHLGFHWGIFLGLGRKKLCGGQPLPLWGKAILCLAAVGVAAYGLICFFRQGIPDYLFLRTEFAFFDYSLPPFTVLSQCVSIFSLWMLVGYLLRKGMQAWDRKVQRHRISKLEMY